MRQTLATIFLAIVFSFIFVFGLQIFESLFIEPDDKFISNASSAFLGAFFAFLFVRIADFFKAYADRVAKGYDTLVKLQYMFNSLMSAVDDNIYVIEYFEGIYSKNIESVSPSVPFVWANRLGQAPLFGELLPDLLNADLANELFSLNTEIRKLNDSCESTNLGYKEAKDAFIAKNIETSAYIDNLTMLHERLLEIKPFHNRAIDDSIHALAAIRVLLRKKPLITYVLRKIAMSRYSEHFEKNRASEKLVLEDEILKSKEEGKRKISEVLGEKNNDS